MIKVSPALCRVIWGYGCKRDNWWLRSPNNTDNVNVGETSGNNNGNNNTVSSSLPVRPDLPQLPETRG